MSASEPLPALAFEPAAPGVAVAAPLTFAAMRALPAAGAIELPVSSRLYLQDEAAKTLRVSASGENLSLDAALGLLAAVSGCSIFQDGDGIVVERCQAE